MPQANPLRILTGCKGLSRRRWPRSLTGCPPYGLRSRGRLSNWTGRDIGCRKRLQPTLEPLFWQVCGERYTELAKSVWLARVI